jgi:MalT-like TPR region
MEAVSLMLLGGVTYAQGDLVLARSREERALELFRAGGNDVWMAGTEWYLGSFAVAEGKLPEAARMYEQCLQRLLITDTRTRWFKPLVGLADVAAACGRFESAARLLGAVDHLLESQAVRLFPFDVPGYERATEASISALGESTFAALHAEGRHTTPDNWLSETESIVLAAQEREAVGRSSRPYSTDGPIAPTDSRA